MMHFTYELSDGRTVHVDAIPNRPDRSAGIMGWWAEITSITDDKGNDVELTANEFDHIIDVACDKAEEYGNDGPDYEPEDE